MCTRRKVSLKLLAQRSSAAAPRNPYPLPPNFKFLKVMGEGGFGKVIRCANIDTNSVVAIKLPRFKQCSKKEVDLLKKLMSEKLDQHSIVKFYGSFRVRDGEAMVFESLELSLEDHILKNNIQHMLLSDIRTVTKQVATALNALKSLGVIHTDIKPDNIMLVDQIRPFKVKLIDFGLAIDRSIARAGMALQTLSFRSPEIILGLPFSEAIDMWSVGCLLFTMLFSRLLFETNEYVTLRFMMELLGQPPDNLLDQGLKTGHFFVKTGSNSWRIKTPEEYWRKKPSQVFRRHMFSSLDDLKKIRMQNKAEAAEHKQCIELMKAMLKMDQADRITPSEVLQHPFITQKKQIDRHVKSDVTKKTTSSTHSGVILGRPARQEYIRLEEQETSAIVLSRTAEDTETPPPPDDDSKEEKKKKNCFQRLKSWFKKKFFCNRVSVM